MFGKTQHVHLVGIGGAGLSGIAHILSSLGFRVSGSDIRGSEITQTLIESGVKVYIGHAPEQLGDADVVVVSPAIPESNPEVLEANKQKIPVIRGAEMLAEIMRMQYGIAISGTHGKTTTTAMTAAVLETGGLDPTVVVGGKLLSLGGNARLGHSDFMVVEADEAYGSIKKFWPTIAVVTSIDEDHLDYYQDVDDIEETFQRFINRIPFYGKAVVCLDQEHIQHLIPHIEKRFSTYGLNTRADLTADHIQFEEAHSVFHVHTDRHMLGTIRLRMPGHHNVSNALAAASVGLELDIPFDKIKEALESFQGVHRRFEVLGKAKNIIVVDDYAHNPAKLRATFQAARDAYRRRIIGVFQPHRYQRVKHLQTAFARSFYQTDVLIVTQIYGAGETPIDGISGSKLADMIRAHGHKDVVYLPTQEEIVEHLLQITRSNDIVITVGAGDIWRVGREFLAQIQNN